MATLDLQVSTSGDDTFRTTAGAAFSATADLVVAGKNNVPDTQGSSMRFLDVNVPRGAEITTAYLIFTCNYADSGTTVLTNIYGNDADDSTAPTSAAEFDALTKTTASTAWDSLGAWVVSTEYDSDSIVDIVQEIVNRSGWEYGNSMQFIWEDDGSSTNARRRGYSYDGSTSLAPQLHIEFKGGYEFIGDGIKTRLETISDLARVYAPKELPNSINQFPCALILPGETQYNKTFTNKLDAMFRILVVMSKQDNPSALNRLLDYMHPTGADSVYKAIDDDTTLDGNAEDSFVVNCSGAGAVTWGGHVYLGTEFEVIAYG